MGKTFVIRTLYANIITTVGLVLFKSIPPITKSEVLFVLYGGVILKCRFSSRSICYYGGVLCL
ncbi:YitT family protein [Peribacillus frigoritolerans]|uniref:YitT family protein n=1 Tax=Peribacillus frigoritolerans TaxID=450367 RepID=UPI003F833ACC